MGKPKPDISLNMTSCQFFVEADQFVSEKSKKTIMEG